MGKSLYFMGWNNTTPPGLSDIRLVMFLGFLSCLLASFFFFVLRPSLALKKKKWTKLFNNSFSSYFLFPNQQFEILFLKWEKNVKVSCVLAANVSFFRKITKCKESQIGKQLVVVSSNVMVKLEGHDIKVKGLLEELALCRPESTGAMVDLVT